MPAEPPDRRGDDLVTGAPEDELTFAVHDLGRERAAARPAPDLGFVAARPAVPPSPAPVATPPAHPAVTATPAAPRAPAHDGFVIREAAGGAPAAPVDALVVGAPEPVKAADPQEGGDADAAPAGFRISATTATRPAPADQLWTTRKPTGTAVPETPAPSRRGWSTRHSDVVDRSAQATMLRLREEAVNVTWKAAWIAVTTCNPRLLRKRRGDVSDQPGARGRARS